MQILFAHQNYPAQFGAFSAYLARIGWKVAFITEKDDIAPPPGVQLIRMTPHREATKGVHRFALPLEKAMINGQAFANAAIQARDAGLRPDIVVAHSGWGSGTFAKAVWPDCKYVSYVEWYYNYPHADAVRQDTDDDLPRGRREDGRANALARNAPTLLDFAEADLVFCPTHFQASQFPDWLRARITVLHDGVDTRMHAPDPAARPPLPGGQTLPEGAELITYATRGMEPHRGFPEFMQALALLQKRRPQLHALIGGQDRVAYGAKLGEGRSWKQIMLEKLDLDESRLYWPGLLPRAEWCALLQSTQAHVYLTVPFVLSWSLLEAMATACPLVVSDTPPVREVIAHGVSAEMVDHTDIGALAAAIERILDDRRYAARLGEFSRMKILQDFDEAWVFPARARQLSDLVNFSSI